MSTYHAELTPEETAYQLARPNEISTDGLNAYRIVLLIIVEVAVVLRMVGRRMQRIALRLDDYLLIFSAILLIGWNVCGILSVKWGYGHHTLILQQKKFKDVYPSRVKAGYVNGILYQICWPVSRISLVLLYQRVFVKVWFKYACWCLIGAYVLFAIPMTIAQIFITIPINAQWKRTTPRHKIDTDKYISATNIFNVITDVMLITMPLVIVWRLKVKTLTKFGLSFVFSLGCLTLLASIMRLYTTEKYKKSRDPEWTGAPGSWWLGTEISFGVLCPCLVTLQPIFIYIYRAIGSQFSLRNRERASRVTGVDLADESPESPSEKAVNVHVSEKNGSTQVNANSLSSKPSDIEAQQPAMPNDQPSARHHLEP